MRTMAGGVRVGVGVVVVLLVTFAVSTLARGEAAVVERMMMASMSMSNLYDF